jgi:hypothetical protein
MFLSNLNSMYYHIVLICMLLESYWNCVSFGGSFAQLWLVMAKLWPFEGWLSFRSWFQDNDVFFAHCEVSSNLVIMVCILLGSSWKMHHLVIVFSVLSWFDKDMTIIGDVQTTLWLFYCEVATSMDYWFLLRIHIISWDKFSYLWRHLKAFIYI